MKILVASLGLGPDDDRLWHKEIMSLLGAGYEVVLVTRKQAELPATDNFRHIDLGAVSITDFNARLLKITRLVRPDALQVHEFQLLVVAAKIKRRLQIPIIYDAQDANVEMWATFSSRPRWQAKIINGGLNLFEKWFSRNVDSITALSDHIAQRYRAWGRRVSVVENYPRQLECDAAAERAPVVLYHGQLSTERGLVVLLKSFALVHKQVRSARLEILGTHRSPQMRTEIEVVIEHIGLSGYVDLRPPIPYLDLLERLQTVQVGVIPFLDRPLFRVAPPNKLFEYYHAGCAVVASDLPLLRRLGRAAALYSAPGDIEGLAENLITLLEDPQLCRELGAKGRAIANAEMSWETVEPNYLDIYRRLL